MKLYIIVSLTIATLGITTSLACVFRAANDGPTPTTLPQATETAVKELGAQDIVDLSREKVKEVKSVHFRLEIANGRMNFAPGISINNIEGDGVEPGRLRIKTSVTILGMPVDVELIAIDGKQFTRDGITKRWQMLSAPLPQTNFFDPEIGLANIMRNLKNTTKLPNEAIDGVNSYHIEGTLDPATLSAVFGGAPAGTPIKAELWIGAEDYLVRQIRLEGPILQEDGPTISRTLTLSRFNEPVTIEAPVATP